MAAYLNSLGLILDIIGVVLLFKYGLPEEVSRKGTGALLLEGNDPSEIAKAKSYDRTAQTALALLVTGFALQIISNHMG